MMQDDIIKTNPTNELMNLKGEDVEKVHNVTKPSIKSSTNLNITCKPSVFLSHIFFNQTTEETSRVSWGNFQDSEDRAFVFPLKLYMQSGTSPSPLTFTCTQ